MVSAWVKITDSNFSLTVLSRHIFNAITQTKRVKQGQQISLRKSRSVGNERTEPWWMADT